MSHASLDYDGYRSPQRHRSRHGKNTSSKRDYGLRETAIGANGTRRRFRMMPYNRVPSSRIGLQLE